MSVPQHDGMAYDLITIGRVGMDLFSQNVGAPFAEIEGFDAAVGGSPSNIAIGSSRLGLKVALLTAVGDDNVGDFVLRTLKSEGVDTRFIPCKAGTRTGLAVVGIEPPDSFPLVFYRQNPADVYVNIEDVRAMPVAQSRALLLSGTALSRGPCREATLYAAELARTSDTTTFLDLDLRPDQWEHPGDYGVNMRATAPLVDIVIGTEEECFAALSPNPETVMEGQRLEAAQQEELDSRVAALVQMASGPRAVIVKHGPGGASVYRRNGEMVQAAGFPVEVLNTVGAGDAFASGLIYGYLQGWGWRKSIRMGNACGAIVVTRHGCATAMPLLEEVQSFVHLKGGF